MTIDILAIRKRPRSLVVCTRVCIRKTHRRHVRSAVCYNYYYKCIFKKLRYFSIESRGEKLKSANQFCRLIFILVFSCYQLSYIEYIVREIFLIWFQNNLTWNLLNEIFFFVAKHISASKVASEIDFHNYFVQRQPFPSDRRHICIDRNYRWVGVALVCLFFFQN